MGVIAMSQCTAFRRDGGRCKGVAIDASGLCYSHDPNRADARRRAARKGGQRGGRGRPVSEVARMQRRLEDLAEQVMNDEVARADAAVAGQLYNYALRAISVGLKAREVEELIPRLEELERLLENRKETRWSA